MHLYYFSAITITLLISIITTQAAPTGQGGSYETAHSSLSIKRDEVSSAGTPIVDSLACRKFCYVGSSRWVCCDNHPPEDEHDITADSARNDLVSSNVMSDSRAAAVEASEFLIKASRSIPLDDAYTNSCNYTDYFVLNAWNIKIQPQDGQNQTNCGKTYLDDLQSLGCVVTGWRCNFTQGDGLDLKFNADKLCNGKKVEYAIYEGSGRTIPGVNCGKFGGGSDSHEPVEDSSM